MRLLLKSASKGVQAPGKHGSTHWYYDQQGHVVYGERPQGHKGLSSHAYQKMFTQHATQPDAVEGAAKFHLDAAHAQHITAAHGIQHVADQHTHELAKHPAGSSAHGQQLEKMGAFLKDVQAGVHEHNLHIHPEVTSAYNDAHAAHKQAVQKHEQAQQAAAQQQNQGLQIGHPTGEWPTSLSTLKEVKALPGSTGAKLMQDPATGRQFVVKRGKSPDQIREEMQADALYTALGVPVPAAKNLGTEQEPVKVAEFLQGKTLKETSGQTREAAEAKIRTHFVADALLANWDVVGLDDDNQLVMPDGAVYHIDNGGSLRYRAQGSPKGDLFDDQVGELWSLRDAQRNPQSTKVFGPLTMEEVVQQCEDLVERLPKALECVQDPQLREKLEARGETLANFAEMMKLAGVA